MSRQARYGRPTMAQAPPYRLLIPSTKWEAEVVDIAAQGNYSKGIYTPTDTGRSYSGAVVSDSDESALLNALQNLSTAIDSFAGLPIPRDVLQSARNLSDELKAIHLNPADISPTRDQSIIFAVPRQEIEFHIEVFPNEEFSLMKTGRGEMRVHDFNSLHALAEFLKEQTTPGGAHHV